MLRNYLHIALRVLARYRVASTINTLGLGLGIGVFIIIMVFVGNEYKYDRFIHSNERVFRVELGDWALMGPGFASTAKQICPEVEEAVSIEQFTFTNMPVKVNEQSFKMESIYPVSKEFFNLFNFKVVHGQQNDLLEEPNSIILTQAEAHRLFGKENPVGKTIKLYDTYLLTVKAVIEPPMFFHLPIRALIPLEITELLFNDKGRLERFLGNQNNPTYLKLRSKSDVEKVTKTLSEFGTRYSKSETPLAFYLRPITDIYLNGALPFEGYVKHGNIRFIRVMVVVAFLILSLACINYINLTTAQAACRAKEIGIRKVSGASRLTIAAQFIGESILTVIIATFLGVVFAELFTPIFGNLIEKQVTTMLFANPAILTFCLVGAVLLGIVSGLYPAIHLSSINPSRSVNQTNLSTGKGLLVRKLLLVFQFVVSAGLIVATLVIFSQLKYFVNHNVGFNKEQVVNIAIPKKTVAGYTAFRESMLSIEGVQGIAQSNSVPGHITWQESWVDKDGESHNFSYLPVDPDYIDVMGLTIIQGRNFDWSRISDINDAYIVNEQIAKLLGFDDPIGKTIPGLGNRVIVGVVKDFNFNSLHSAIGPLALNFRNRNYNTYNIRVDISSIPYVIKDIERVWSEYAVDTPFEYSFLNETFENLYRSEVRMGKLFGYFATVAIAIGCMGLFGLSTFILQARRKEMGIRKVMGASVFSIVNLLSREFLALIALSCLLAWPIAYWAMNWWLSSFPYRTQQNISTYLASLFVCLAVAIATVGYHTWRIARANPSNSIRYE